MMRNQAILVTTKTKLVDNLIKVRFRPLFLFMLKVESINLITIVYVVAALIGRLLVSFPENLDALMQHKILDLSNKKRCM